MPVSPSYTGMNFEGSVCNYQRGKWPDHESTHRGYSDSAKESSAETEEKPKRKGNASEADPELTPKGH